MKSQQPAIIHDWTWIEKERGIEISESYPDEIDYETYASHPDLRIIGCEAYDKNGKLVGRLSLGIDENQILREIQDDYIRMASIEDFKRDRYGFSRESSAAQAYVKHALGLTKQGSQYLEKEKNVANRYLRQLRMDHEREAHCISDIIRITDTSFVAMLADNEGMPNCAYLVEYTNDGKYKSKYTYKFTNDFQEGIIEGETTNTTDQPQLTPVETKKDTSVKDAVVEISPEFLPCTYNNRKGKKVKNPGGEEGVRQYLSDVLIYPEIAYENGIQGNIIVSFNINEDGSVGDVRIVKGIDLLNKEAIRVVSAMPKWKPATKNGQPVKTKWFVPVNFRLQY